MPIYEFYSPDTHRIYSFLARSPDLAKSIPLCPDKPEARMERVLSQFSVSRGVEEISSLPPGEETATANMLAEMEREMAAAGGAGQDPRQLGKIMRSMAEAAGQKIPADLQQMITRLEKGENPQKLEDEYTSILNDLAQPGDEGELDTSRSASRRLFLPQRDPILYEMREFLHD